MNPLFEKVAEKLHQIGFTGDFLILGISLEEAAALDNASLMRRINEANGVAEAFQQANEARVRQLNEEFEVFINAPVEQ